MRFKNTHILYCFFVILLACSQRTIESQNNEGPSDSISNADINSESISTYTSEKILDTIDNEKTTRHVHIPGTRLYIVPPKDFTITSAPSGLQKNENTMIVITESKLGGNFYSDDKAISKEELEKRGAKVLSHKEIILNGYPATYVFMTGDANVHMLKFGDTTFMTMLVATYPLTDKGIENDVISSLNSIWFDKEKIIDPFETAIFNLNEHVGSFKFNRFASNMYIYTINGKENQTNKDPILIICQLVNDESITIAKIAEIMVEKLKDHGMSNLKIGKTSHERINNLEAIQIESKGIINNIVTNVYTCVVRKGANSIIIQGTEYENPPRYIEEFKKISYALEIN